MKKLIILLIILNSINNCSSANIIDEIENKRLDCLNTNYQSDYIMAQCNYEAINSYNKQIKLQLKLLKKLLTKYQYKLLLDSNLDWETYIKNDNLLIKSIFENKQYAEPYLISSGIQCQNKKHYLEKLIIIYQYLNEIEK